MDRKAAEKLQQAEAFARDLTPELTAQSLENRKNEAIRRFFGEGGIPKELYKGWAIYEERREKRAEVGAPLPPGGVLLLGREATVAGLMAEAHNKLSAGLKLPTNAIRLKLKRDDLERVNLVADANPPKNWVIPVPTMGREPEQAAREYIQSVLVGVNQWFRETLSERLEACETIRTDVQ